MHLIFSNTEEDIKALIIELIYTKSIIFNFNPNPTTEFTISLVTDFKVLSSNHGDPYDSILVSIIKRGTFWFPKNKKTHPEYVQEKLMLSDQESKALTILLNGITSELRKCDEIEKETIKHLEDCHNKKG